MLIPLAECCHATAPESEVNELLDSCTTQTAHLIMTMVLLSAVLLEVVGFLGAEGWLLHHHLKLLW